ncbi:MAG TPA: hypothetical protein VIM30_04005 [Candidatus Limnocylindrales bacterium]|jgi:hypothetical protein
MSGRLTLGGLWAYLAVGLPILGALIAPLPSVDLAYQLRAGDGILATGTIPTTDTFTFTVAGSPWLDQQWAAQAILAAVFRVSGWTGIGVLRAALVGAVFGFLFIAIRRRNPGVAMRDAALVTLGAFVVAAVALAPRPQLFGLVLFGAVLAILADRRHHPGRLWLIPVLLAAWANVHGSFPLGILVTGLAWVEDVHERAPRASRTLLVAIAAALASLVNPVGLRAWEYGAGLAANPVIRSRLTEWQPTSLADPAGVLFLLSLGAIGVLLARRSAVAPWPALLTLGIFALIGLAAVRGIGWWAPVAAIVAAGLLPASPPLARERRATALNTVVAALIALAAVAVLPIWRPLDPGLGAPRGLVTYAPPGVTAALGSLVKPGDRIWNPQAWGSWFEFAVPQAKVAVDSRVELFPVSLWDDVDAVSSARVDWSKVLARWGVTILVTQPGQTTLAQALGGDAGWRRAFADGDGSVWVRADRSGAPLFSVR